MTSMWIQAWGLIHSISVTLPSSRTGLLASNSAENEWWALSGSAARRTAVQKFAPATLIRLTGLLSPPSRRRSVRHKPREEYLPERSFLRDRRTRPSGNWGPDATGRRFSRVSYRFWDR